VKSEWRVRGGKFHLDVTIPANTTATVHIPLDKGTRISESGRPATDSKGLRLLETGKDEAIFSAQAGSYHFIVQ
jgi:alpha-L-rhamnosidase